MINSSHLEWKVAHFGINISTISKITLKIRFQNLDQEFPLVRHYVKHSSEYNHYI